ncbi:B3GT4 galactosyltransferase, partial [Oreotrochilus melanogaster]|nr:B3GT4 galactosyltransferase [Oreotrochilus melanogaster]
NAQAAVRAEFGRYRDLLQGSFPDRYRHLNLKTLLGFRWALSRCPAVHFLLKADDDVYINVPSLLLLLRPQPGSESDPEPGPEPEPLYLGRVHWWVPPQR